MEMLKCDGCVHVGTELERLGKRDFALGDIQVFPRLLRSMTVTLSALGATLNET